MLEICLTKRHGSECGMVIKLGQTFNLVSNQLISVGLSYMLHVHCTTKQQ